MRGVKEAVEDRDPEPGEGSREDMKEEAARVTPFDYREITFRCDFLMLKAQNSEARLPKRKCSLNEPTVIKGDKRRIGRIDPESEATPRLSTRGLGPSKLKKKTSGTPNATLRHGGGGRSYALWLGRSLGGSRWGQKGFLLSLGRIWLGRKTSRGLWGVTEEGDQKAGPEVVY